MRKVLFATLTILTVAFGSLSFMAPAHAATERVLHRMTLDDWGADSPGGA